MFLRFKNKYTKLHEKVQKGTKMAYQPGYLLSLLGPYQPGPDWDSLKKTNSDALGFSQVLLLELEK